MPLAQEKNGGRVELLNFTQCDERNATTTREHITKQFTVRSCNIAQCGSDRKKPQIRQIAVSMPQVQVEPSMIKNWHIDWCHTRFEDNHETVVVF